MSITPAYIKELQFSKVMRGYKPEEVMEFLEKLSAELDILLNENSAAKNELEEAQAVINAYKKIESDLQDTLSKAYDSSAQTINNAKQQAEAIIKEAEEKAAEIVEKAQEEAESIRSAVISLKEERNMIVARLKAIINSQAALLEMKIESIDNERPLPKRINDNDMFEFNIDDIIEKLL